MFAFINTVGKNFYSFLCSSLTFTSIFHVYAIFICREEGLGRIIVRLIGGNRTIILIPLNYIEFNHCLYIKRSYIYHLHSININRQLFLFPLHFFYIYIYVYQCIAQHRARISSHPLYRSCTMHMNETIST